MRRGEEVEESGRRAVWEGKEWMWILQKHGVSGGGVNVGKWEWFSWRGKQFESEGFYYETNKGAWNGSIVEQLVVEQECSIQFQLKKHFYSKFSLFSLRIFFIWMLSRDNDSKDDALHVAVLFIEIIKF